MGRRKAKISEHLRLAMKYWGETNSILAKRDLRRGTREWEEKRNLLLNRYAPVLSYCKKHEDVYRRALQLEFESNKYHKEKYSDLKLHGEALGLVEYALNREPGTHKLSFKLGPNVKPHQNVTITKDRKGNISISWEKPRN